MNLNTSRFYIIFIGVFLLFYPAEQTLALDSKIFNHINQGNGLSHSTTWNIYQDKFNFYWVSTMDGLNLYDGHTFTNFFHDPSDSLSIGSNVIYNVMEDHLSNIIITTNKGLFQYNRSSNHFTNLFIPTNKKQEENRNEFFATLEDQRYHLWSFSNISLIEYDPILKKIIDWSDSLSFNKDFFRMACDKKGNIYINCHSELNIIQIQKKITIFNQNHNPSNKDIFNKKVTDFCFDESENLYVLSAEEKRITIYDKNLNPFESIELKLNARIKSLYVTNYKQIWVITDGAGIYLYDDKKKDFNVYKHIENEENSICSNDILNIYKDHYGNIWFCTNEGLDYITARRLNITSYRNFGYFKNDTNIRYSLSDVMFDTTSSWVSGWGNGLSYLDYSTGKIKSFVPGQSENESYINEICEFNNEMWIGSYNGLYSFDLKTKTFKSFHKDNRFPSGTNKYPIIRIYKENEKSLWLSSNDDKGIFHFTTEKNYFEHFGIHETKDNRISFRNFSAITSDRLGNVWLGYNRHKGLLYYDKSMNTFIEYFSGKDGIPDEYVTCLNLIGSDLWIGSNNGLYCYSVRDRKSTLYSRLNGLGGDNINAITSDHKGNIWVASNNGISVLQNDMKTIINFTSKDGLPEESINDLRYDSRGWFYGLTQHEFFFFPYPDILFNFSRNKAILSSIKVNGTVIGIPENNHLTLNPNENILTVSFATPISPNESNVFYSYLLEGFDKEWNSNYNSPIATYTNLKAGNYKLKVRSSTDAKNWTETSPLTIKVIPPFYLTGWFILLCSVVIIILIFISISISSRIKLQKILIAQKIRNDIAADLHDDIGTTLSSISLMSEIAKQKIDLHKEESTHYLNIIGEQSRQLIDQMSDIIFNIDPFNDELENIVVRMRLFASTLLEKKDICLNFTSQIDANYRNINIHQKKNLYLIFKESINNIYKHSQCSQVTVLIMESKDKLVIEISDNGIGFQNKANPLGNGLRNIKNRVGEIKGEVEIISDYMSGTTVRLIIPTYTL